MSAYDPKPTFGNRIASMTFRQHLARTEIVAIAALFVAAIAIASFAFLASGSPSDIFSPLGAAIAYFAYTMMIGTIPVMVFGAPLYAWLISIGKASWVAALVIGVFPGLLFLFVASDLALWAIACGTFVAFATHVFSNRGTGNRLLPEQPRGSN